MRVTVIGTGYVGTVTGACLAWLGHRVTCVDSDAVKIAKLQGGDPVIYEPGLRELLAPLTGSGMIDFAADSTASVRDSEVIFIAVGTPPLESGESDLSYLEAAARSIGTAMDASRFRVVVNKSTVPVGSGNLVGALVREGITATDVQFGVASNPEFLREGSAISDTLYPDRIVIGAEDSESARILRELYRPLIEQTFIAPESAPRPESMRRVPVVATSLASAEMIKYSANAFLAMKIGFANEMAGICEHVGADVQEVMVGTGLDARIGASFLNAGIGWGGSCFGKDVASLLHTAGRHGYPAHLLHASLAVNNQQRQFVVKKLREKLTSLQGRTIALLGLAFKPNTDDLRDAPAIQIAEQLLGLGCRVRAYDPVAHHPDLDLEYCGSAAETADGADALVLATEWPQFAALDLLDLARRMKTPILIDGRNFFDAEAARAAGFDYTGIGRGPGVRRACYGNS